MSDTSFLEKHIIELLQANCETPVDALTALVGVLVRIHSSSSLEAVPLADYLAKFKEILDETSNLMGDK